ncbi:MAG: hypothetical protein LUI39_13015 [Lachnospiraceae bacterium]|nr:hypothetical protein [Lachnospiraceae bacterium]
MRIGYDSIQNTQIYNMGSVTMTGSEEAGEFWIRILTAFYNYSDLRIESEAPDSGKIEVSLEGMGAFLTNTGTLVLGENSYLYSSTKIHNCGTIFLEAENAEFANYGVLYSNESTSVLRAVEGSSWDAYGGAVLYSQDSTVDIPDSNDADFLCYGYWSTTETVRWVSSENDLNIALVDEDCRYIILEDGSTIEVSGDLTLTDKLLVMNLDSALIIRDGDLTISGENSGLYGKGGTLNLYGGSLILEDGCLYWRLSFLSVRSKAYS